MYNSMGSEEMKKRGGEWIEGLAVRKRWPTKPKVEDTAFLVIDMQNYFLSPDSHAYLPAAEAIVENINFLVEYFSSNGVPVIFTRTVQGKGDEGVMEEWWNDIIREGPEAQLWDEIKVEGRKIKKPRYSSFFRTDLEEHLKGVENVVIGGVMTDMCCATTARDAFVRDYRVFFLADGTATSSEDAHVSTLNALCRGTAEVLTCQEMKERFR